MKYFLSGLSFFLSASVFSLSPVGSLFFNSPKDFSASVSKHPIYFQENLGQVTDQNYKPRTDILFSGTDGQLAFHLKKNGISYQQSNVVEWQDDVDLKTGKKNKIPTKTDVYRIDVNWLNCNTIIETEKKDLLPGYCNYYTAGCPSGVTNVRSYGEIIYKNIYNGIDLKWYQKNGNLKYDYYVAAGADHSQIQLQFEGATHLSISKSGELIITTPLGKIIEQAPYVTQNNKRVKAEWQLNNKTASFKVINYNPALPMIIDPAVRVWGTYYGGTGNVEVSEACITFGTFIYLTGYTDSNNGTSIATVGSHQSVYSGGVNDAYLAKFDTTGNRIWATYYGGGIREAGMCLATDPSGNIFMGGYSMGGAAMVSPGAHQLTSGGNWDGFLAKFNSSGIRQWSTLYGGSGPDFAQGCATDLLGNVYLSGKTDSNTGISTPSGHQPTFGGVSDAFLVKFNSAGVRTWGTYYGDIYTDGGFGCCTDANNDVYLTGVTDGTLTGAISTVGSHQANNGGTMAPDDAFLVKFNGAGTRLWGTYYGGLFNEVGYAVVCDPLLNVYLTGKTESINGTSIATAASHQTANNGGLHDAFLVKFNSTGARQWGTYYGGANDDVALSCSRHSSGDIYIAGYTSSSANSNEIATTNGPQNGYGGGAMDGFIAQFTDAGVRQWGSFYGPGGDDYIYGCATDNFYNVYVGGATNSSTGFGIASIFGHQNTYGGGAADGYLVRFFDCAVPANPLSTTPSAGLNGCVGLSTTLTASGSGTLTWYPTQTSTSPIGTGTNYVTPVLAAGVYTYYVEAKTCTISAGRTPITVTVNAVPTISVNSITSSSIICAGQSATFQASGANTYTWSTGTNSNIAVVYPTVTTTYTVTGTNAAGCNGSNTISISVYPSPQASLTASSNTACLIIFGGTPIPLTGNPPGGTYSGVNVSGGSFNPTAIGNFTPMYTYTDSTTNCISTASVNITVASCLGISENKNSASSKIDIIPNPNNGNCKISSDVDLDLNIIDQLGRIITTVSLNETNAREVTLSNLASGVYFVMNKNSEQKINRKIVVIK